MSEIARKVIWNCLVEEPTLFLRTFLEKITHKDKRVKNLIFFLLNSYNDNTILKVKK